MPRADEAVDGLVAIGRQLDQAQVAFDDDLFDEALRVYGVAADDLVMLLTTCPDRGVVPMAEESVERIFDAFVRLELRFALEQPKWLDHEWARWELDQLLAAWRDLSGIVGRDKGNQS